MIRRDVAANGISVLQLSHGKVNALDIDLCSAIVGALNEEDESGHCRAIVLTGEGGVFSAGVDLHKLIDGGRDYVVDFLDALDRCFRRVLTFPRPIVAAINGHAIAGGCVLAAACDLRLMADGNGRIGVPELAVGIPLPSLLLAIIRAQVAPNHLRELLLLGETVGPSVALGAGLIDAVVPPEGLLPAALDTAATLAAIPRLTFSTARRQLTRAVLDDAARLAEFDADVQSLWCSPDSHATIRAYLERTIGKSRQ